MTKCSATTVLGLFAMLALLATKRTFLSEEHEQLKRTFLSKVYSGEHEQLEGEANRHAAAAAPHDNANYNCCNNLRRAEEARVAMVACVAGLEEDYDEWDVEPRSTKKRMGCFDRLVLEASTAANRELNELHVAVEAAERKLHAAEARHAEALRDVAGAMAGTIGLTKIRDPTRLLLGFKPKSTRAASWARPSSSIPA